MNANKRKYVGAILGMALVIGLSACDSSVDPPTGKPGGLAVGDRAANFSLVDSDGKIMKLSEIQPGWGLVLIFYRGSWCDACQNQLLNLKEDYPKFAPLHAALAAVSVDTVEASAAFNKEWRFPFPLLSDPGLRLINDYDLRSPQGHDGKDISKPAVIILDPKKIIRYKYVGTSPIDRPSDDEILFQVQKINSSSPVS